MRITNGIIAANTISSLNSALLNETKVNQEISTNKKIQTASDDPLVATRAVTYRNYVSQVSQYQDNVSAAQGWQSESDSSLSSLSSVITNLKELATQASSSTSSSDYSSIKTEVETDLDEVTSLMNSDYSGSYVFGGYNTTEEPYQVVSTSIGDTATYNGKYISLGGVVASDVSDSDILSYYNSNSDNAYNSLTTVRSAYATGSTMYGILTDAIDTYGGTANIEDAATSAETTSKTLASATDTYGTTCTLASAVASAKTAYDTAEAASEATPSDTTLSTTASEDKAAYDALYTAYTTTYSSSPSVTLASVASNAQTVADALAQAVSNTDENIKYNVGFSSEVTVNINGQDVTGQGSNNLFNTIQKFKLALDGDTSYKTVTLNSAGTASVTTESLDISDLIDEFSSDLDRVTVQQSKLGARMNRVSLASDTLSTAEETYKGLMENNENIDTATAATELTNAEYTYEATLSVSSKILGKSLIDYIS